MPTYVKNKLTIQQRTLIKYWIDTQFYPLINNNYLGGIYSKTEIRKTLHGILKAGEYWPSEKDMLNQIRQRWIDERFK